MVMVGTVQPPVTLAEAQAYLRLETGEEEALLAGLIRTATMVCEAFIGQIVLAREFSELVTPNGAWQRLVATPVRSMAAVEAVAGDGTVLPLDDGAVAIDIDSSGDGWVRATCADGVRVRIGGTAGMAAVQNEVPEPIRQGVLRLVAHMFNDRDSGAGEPPAAVTALWRPFRRMRLA